EPDDLDYRKGGGLVTGVVQHAESGQVLMVGYLDEAAVRATLTSGLATFYSRTRQTQWTKGESSGNTLRVLAVDVDCDRDTVLMRALPAGPTCHTGQESCFDDARALPVEGEDRVNLQGPPPSSFLPELDALIAGRHAQLPEGSYTTSLFDSGVRRIAQKVGEEGVETALAAVAQDDDALLGEASDLIYHLLVLLRSRDLSLADVESVLRVRHGTQP
ncbi:bifunctional phosphoribosyl-AMP cyclohydrolase/phosphoribosyl-ATP diphosphatase HisIE, partial [Ornithinimicrobium sp.]|uniref:bifunctional phosphoribosyl-AMP cyclohydrolase/phosphoribosyl-ATP diphosphatase HisIE n=1 Tax=Ornithinimicrobium sp. TaxID=1977084 RepID=UPI0034CDBAF8